MRSKRLCSILLLCALVLGCFAMPVSAANIPDGDLIMPLASGSFRHTLSKNSTVAIDAEFYLDTGDTISYNCTYTPKSASIDFGFVAPDGLFYSLNSTTGSINKSIRVNQTGSYTLAIRNNENYAVTVSGTVKY